MTPRLPVYFLVFVALLFVAGTSIDGLAQEAEEASPPALPPGMPEQDPAGYRKFIKQAMQSHLSAFGLILTFRAPYEENFALHADALVTLSKAHASLYPGNSQTDATRPAIWEQPEAFAAAMEKSRQAAIRLQETVAMKNRHALLNRFVRLSESCGDCHAKFKVAE